MKKAIIITILAITTASIIATKKKTIIDSSTVRPNYLI